MLAALPFVLLAGAIAWQLALAGWTAWMSAHAARVAARADAVGRPVEPAARSALPSPLRDGLRVRATTVGWGGGARPRADAARARPRPGHGHGGVVARQAGAMRRLRPERGQALVEVIAAVPVLLLVGLVLLQALAVGYAAVLAGTAAHAGALALAAGGDARAGVRESLPGWSRAGARVEVAGGQVRVRLRPPSPLAALARELEMAAEAGVEES